MPLGEYVLVEVEDTGTGIPPDIIDKIFDPFFTTKEIGKGTGLGLSTVYGIIKQTGGFIYVSSELERARLSGSSCRANSGRRRHRAAEAPEATRRRWPAPVGGRRRSAHRAAADLTGHGTILLVEDEEGLRRLNARGLASRGYTVIEAGNGIEAMEVLERHGGHVDLVVSDVVMPEMDGPTLLKELRERNPKVRIIFVSGYAEDAFEQELAGRRPAGISREAVHAQAAHRRRQGNDGLTARTRAVAVTVPFVWPARRG